MNPEMIELFSASALKPEVYEGRAWLVNTYDGTEVVPDDLIAASESEVLENPAEFLGLYCSGAIVDDEPSLVSGWLCRLSMAGYLDCSDWMLAESEEHAYSLLAEMV